MILPDTTDIVTTEYAVELCLHFNLEYLVERITASPRIYKSWKFDGCSCIPDKFMGLFKGCNWHDVLYKCCLPHDLAYAYGEPGNGSERKKVDDIFYNDLINKAGMAKWCAFIFLKAVRVGGAEVFGLSFSWGFAHK